MTAPCQSQCLCGDYFAVQLADQFANPRIFALNTHQSFPAPLRASLQMSSMFRFRNAIWGHTPVHPASFRNCTKVRNLPGHIASIAFPAAAVLFSSFCGIQKSATIYCGSPLFGYPYIPNWKSESSYSTFAL